MNDSQMETRVATIIATTTPVWAVFAAEKGDDKIWTERVHLWAHTRTAISAKRAGELTFLGNAVPAGHEDVQGMVICESELLLVNDARDWLFLGYSETQTPAVDERWRKAIEIARQKFARNAAETEE
jgi:hypothetical protein